jgi:hypothetical protein
MYINVVKTAFAFPQQWGLNEINKYGIKSHELIICPNNFH